MVILRDHIACYQKSVYLSTRQQHFTTLQIVSYSYPMVRRRFDEILVHLRIKNVHNERLHY